MKKFITMLSVSTLALLLNSCSVVGGIFKAGVWVGVLGIVFVIALVIFLISKSKK